MRIAIFHYTFGLEPDSSGLWTCLKAWPSLSKVRFELTPFVLHRLLARSRVRVTSLWGRYLGNHGGPDTAARGDASDVIDRRRDEFRFRNLQS